MHFPFLLEESVGRVDDSVGHVDNSIVCVRGMRSGVFVPIVIKSIGDVIMLVVFVPIGVDSKSSRLIEIFWRPKSLFSLQISKSVL